MQIICLTLALEAAIAEENASDEKQPKEKLVLAGLTWVKSSICIHGVLNVYIAFTLLTAKRDV